MTSYIIRILNIILILSLANSLSIANQVNGKSSQGLSTIKSPGVFQTLNSNGPSGLSIKSFGSKKALSTGMSNTGGSFNYGTGGSSIPQYGTSDTSGLYGASGLSGLNGGLSLSPGGNFGASPGSANGSSSPVKIVDLGAGPGPLIDLGLTADSLASLTGNTPSVSPKSVSGNTLSVSSDSALGSTSAPSSSYPVTGSIPNSNGKLDYSKMLQMVNDVRKKAGVGPLKYNDKLNKAAQAHSQDQSSMGKMGHPGSDGSKVGQRVTSANYSWGAVGENVAWNQPSVEEVMKDWIASPGHYKNLVGKDYIDFGCGMINLYWTQVFASSESSY